METVVAALKKGLDVVSEERQDDKTLLLIEDGIQVEVFEDGPNVQIDVMAFVAGANSEMTDDVGKLVEKVKAIVDVTRDEGPEVFEAARAARDEAGETNKGVR